MVEWMKEKKIENHKETDLIEKEKAGGGEFFIERKFLKMFS